MNQNKLQVMYRGRLVGTLAAMPDKRIAFQYSRQWLQEGFALNPLSLPLKDKVYIPGYEPFGGLFGVFADSLPDGWGRLLVDRFLSRGGRCSGAWAVSGATGVLAHQAWARRVWHGVV